MENSNSKSWYLSKAIWGSLVAVVIGTLLMFGVGTELEGEETAIVELIMQIVAVVGGVVALIGRVVARKNIVPFLLIGVMLLGLAGCNDPLYTAEHRQLIRTQAVIVSQLDRHCQAGDNEACKEGLAIAAETLQTLAAEY